MGQVQSPRPYSRFLHSHQAQGSSRKHLVTLGSLLRTHLRPDRTACYMSSLFSPRNGLAPSAPCPAVRVGKAGPGTQKPSHGSHEGWEGSEVIKQLPRILIPRPSPGQKARRK